MSPASPPPVRPFAVTKIRAPVARADAVPRPRLESALGAALLHARLVLLVAPAGFGKTVALSSCIAAARQAQAADFVWISADEDDDLPRISACTVAALEPLKVPWKAWVSPNATAAALSGADAQRRREIANDFVNALAATPVPRGLIVIDDAHRLGDGAIFQFLDHMIERLPPHWGVVLSSRSDPPMALARWRGRGELAEFRQADLRFELQEVRALVGEGAEADPALQPEALLQRTQGWAAGLRMALQARRSGASLSGRHLFDYVASEVLDAMSPAKRSFLLRCAVLPELSPVACRAVSADPDAARWLAEIEREGLFVSVRGEGADAVLVLHELLRDCLEHLLLRELPHELPELLRRAAQHEPDTARRVGFLVRAQAWDAARADLFEAAPGLITAGVVQPLQRLVEQFPAPLRDAPEFHMIDGLSAWAQWNFEAMRVAMNRAVDGFGREGRQALRLWAVAHEAVAVLASRQPENAAPLMAQLDAAEPLEGEVLITALHARVWQALELGPLDQVCVLMNRQLDEIERRPSTVLWYKASPTIRFIGLPGSRLALARYVDGAAAAAGQALSALRVLAALTDGWLELWAGDHAAAEPLLQRAAEDSQWLDQSSVIGWQVAVGRAVVHALRGEVEAAMRMARYPATSSRRSTLKAWSLVVALRVASAFSCHEEVIEVGRQLAQLPAPPAFSPFAAHLKALEGHVMLARGDLQAAEQHWRNAMCNEPALCTLGLDMELRLRLTLSAVRAGDTVQAAQWLRPALARAAADAAHTPLLLGGRAVLAALLVHDWRGLLPAGEWQQLQELWRRAPDIAGHDLPPSGPVPATWTESQRPGGAKAPVPAIAPAFAPALPEGPSPLTQRELEIVRRLVAGDSNKVIARTFALSPHTVKRHVANILGKLQLSSRGQVAAWFHASHRG